MRRASLLVLLLVVSIASGSAAASNAAFTNLRSTRMPLGSTYTITGRTAAAPGSPRATGRVILTGRLNGGPWRFVAQTVTDRDGTFRLKVKPTRRGRFELRLVTPDHRSERVQLTVI